MARWRGGVALAVVAPSCAAALAADAARAAPELGARGTVTMAPPVVEFADKRVPYEQTAFAPGSEACWSSGSFACAPGGGGAGEGRAECEGRAAAGDGFEYRFSAAGACRCLRRPALGPRRRLSFEACCNDTARHFGSAGVGNPACWRGSGGALSFARCCSGMAFPVSELPRYRRLVVAMSSTPFRSHQLEHVLQSMVHQTYKPDAIYVMLPFNFLRDWTWYDLPWFSAMVDPSVVRIQRCEQDFRAASGLLCALQHEPDPDTYIVLVDDDVVYHPTLVETLLHKSALSPGAAIGARAYGRPGVWCRELDAHGGCAMPNLVHTTYGILFQRRFFDAGIFDFASAARALLRAEPGLRGGSDFAVACCMAMDNLWYEAHLAKKGIPRAFYKETFGSKLIGQLAYGWESLFAGFKRGNSAFYHHVDDPHSNNEAAEVCRRATASLWGASLWSARPRHVAAAALPGAAGAAAAAELARLLGRLSWAAHDAVVVFACSGRPLRDWRRLLLDHGAFVDRVAYLHRFAPGLAGLRAPFYSELFDPAAFRPPKFAMARVNRGPLIVQAAASVPGHTGAASARPLAELVELCPAADGEEPPPAQEPPVSLGKGCPKADVLRNVCPVDDGQPRITLYDVRAFAAVRCCDAESQGCLPVSMPRNTSGQWSKMWPCYPQVATYDDAQRICTAVEMALCDEAGATRCCGLGCEVSKAVWLSSPASGACLDAQRAAAPALRAGASLEELAARPWRGAGGGATAGGAGRASDRELASLQDAFLRFSEEARSTVVEWVTDRRV